MGGVFSKWVECSVNEYTRSYQEVTLNTGSVLSHFLRIYGLLRVNLLYDVRIYKGYCACILSLSLFCLDYCCCIQS